MDKVVKTAYTKYHKTVLIEFEGKYYIMRYHIFNHSNNYRLTWNEGYNTKAEAENRFSTVANID